MFGLKSLKVDMVGLAESICKVWLTFPMSGLIRVLLKSLPAVHCEPSGWNIGDGKPQNHWTFQTSIPDMQMTRTANLRSKPLGNQSGQNHRYHPPTILGLRYAVAQLLGHRFGIVRIQGWPGRYLSQQQISPQMGCPCNFFRLNMIKIDGGM